MSGGKVGAIAYERDTGSGWTTIRAVDYSYYGANESSPDGTLKSVAVHDGGSAAQVIKQEYYRWYAPNNSNDHASKLKIWLSSDSVLRARSELNVTDLSTKSDLELQTYADNYFEYDAQNRVTKEIAQGAGCGCGGLGGGGQGAYTFTYTDNANAPWSAGLNAWTSKTVETLPDNTPNDLANNDRNVVYTNSRGDIVFKIFQDVSESKEYYTAYRYDDAGRVVLAADSNAITGFDESLPDLIGYDPATGLATKIGDAGLVTLTDYYTAATAQTPALVGYERATYEQRGDTLSTRVQTSESTYTDGGVAGDGIFYPATYTTFGGATGGTPQTTNYAYTWHTLSGAPTTQMLSRTTTRAAVVASQNGPDATTSSFVSTDTFDSRGNLVWTRDADGYVDYYAYDAATGQNTQMIRDVDPTTIASPSVAAPARGSGLPAAKAVADAMTYDQEGRVTKAVTASGEVTYTVYDDSSFDADGFTQAKTYRWDATNNLPVGPVEVSRNNPALGFKETLTYAWPTTAGGGWVASGAPTGVETVTSSGVTLQSLTRTYYNVSGTTTQVDEYFDLGSGGYPAASSPGTAGVNFLRTTYAYDGRANIKRVGRPDATIESSVYDGLNRLVSQWKGTNDAGASNEDPTGNAATGNNMVRTASYVYDASGNKLESRAHFGSGTSDYYATRYEYDFRSRLVGKVGPDGVGERYTFDNLGQQTKVERFANVTVNSNGTLNYGAASNLRGQIEYAYDAQGRVYRTTTYEVHPSTGAVGDALSQNIWYDRRGNAIKTASANGLFQKTQYDGVGRVVSAYVSYDNAETAWADADDVVGDTVVSQQDVVYVGNWQVIASKLDRTAATGSITGRLTKANARLNASVTWYDAAGRVEDTGGYGTDPDHRVFGSGGAIVDANSDGVPDVYANPVPTPTSNTSGGQLFVILAHTEYDKAGRVESTTDNKGRVTRYTYDLLGRKKAMIENYVGDGSVVGTTSPDTNRTTEWHYDPWGRLVILRALNPLGAGVAVEKQDTQYFYASDVDRSWVSYAIYPDSGNDRDVDANGAFDPNQDAPVDFDWDASGKGFIDTGSANAVDFVADTFDRLGRKVTSTDQRGVVHTYSYDSAGRLSVDKVTSLGRAGENVDGSVRAIGYGYDDQSRRQTVTSYSDVAATTVANQVKLAYDGWGNVVHSQQSHGGAVTGTTPAVGYTYDDGAASGVAKYVRLSKVTYPNGRELFYAYGGADAANDKLNRVYEVGGTASDTDASFDARYFYAGTQTIVRETRADGTSKLDYDPSNNGTLSGFDRFGRVVGQTWSKNTGTASSPTWATTDTVKYAYDENSNRTYRGESPNADYYDVNAARQEFSYDGLDRLIRSVDSRPITDDVTGSQSWGGLDALGNWRSTTKDTDGDEVDDVTQTRTHNAANEITGVSGGSTWGTPTTDAAGNMTRLPPAAGSAATYQTATYDAWNRQAGVVGYNASNVAVATTVNKYDGTGRRISGNAGEAYFDEGWQEIELRNAGNTPTEQNVWSQRYVDALISRDVLSGTATPATAAGTLDTTFDADGKVTLNIDGTDYGRRVAVQADGKILVVGRTGSTTSTYDFAVVRYNADGSIDTSWGTSGVVRTSLGSSDEAFSLAVTASGQVLVVGNVDGQIAVARYNANGTLDTTFGTGGKKVIAGTTWYTRSIVLQSDGKMVLAGQKNANGSTAEGFVLRLLADGSTDSTWNSGSGAVLLGTVGVTSVYGLVLDASGRAVVAGTGKVGSDNTNFAAARITTGGALDTTFGTGGGVVVQFGAGGDSAFDLAIQSDGKIVLAGYGNASSSPYQNVFGMTRLNTNGTLDTAFGTSGKVQGNASAFAAGEGGQANAISIGADGKIVLAGSSGGDFALARYTTSGTLDTTFGAAGTGRVKADFAGGSDGIYGMAKDAQGRFVVAGYAGADLAVARFHGVTVAGAPGTTRQWVQQDANFNVTSLADSSGNVLERYRYTAYGERTVLNAAGGAAVAGNISAYGMQHGHQGGRADAATGLMNFRFRDYGLNFGRWLQRDPLNYLGGANLSAFVGDNPLNRRDPLGLIDSLGDWWEDIENLQRLFDEWGVGVGDRGFWKLPTPEPDIDDVIDPEAPSQEYLDELARLQKAAMDSCKAAREANESGSSDPGDIDASDGDDVADDWNPDWIPLLGFAFYIITHDFGKGERELPEKDILLVRDPVSGRMREWTPVSEKK